MVEVYIWRFRGKREAWGHASALVGTSYISWWPIAVNRVQSKIHPDIYEAHPRPPRFEDDVRDEGGRPDFTIRIAGLDEPRMTAWWYAVYPWAANRHGPPAMPWSTVDWNCSKLVAAGLKEGGGDTFAAWHKSWNLVWTPNDVREYAESIVKGMQARTR